MKTRFVLEAVIAITLITIPGGIAPIFLLDQAYALRESFSEESSKKVPVAISASTLHGRQIRQEMMKLCLGLLLTLERHLVTKLT